MALRRDFFLSLKELIDLTKSVGPDVKDPFKQQGEALAKFFYSRVSLFVKYSYISSMKYFLSKDEICTSFDKKIREEFGSGYKHPSG